MWWEILILVISLIIAIGITYEVIHETDSNTFIASMVAVIFYMLAFLLLINLLGGNKKTPSAIDVYRGNTELQITYQDSIPIDSVVVYKNK